MLQSTHDRLVRVLGLDSEATNWGWLSDKERFGYEASASDTRLVWPLRRNGEGLVPLRWTDASAEVAGVTVSVRSTVQRGFHPNRWCALSQFS